MVGVKDSASHSHKSVIMVRGSTIILGYKHTIRLR